VTCRNCGAPVLLPFLYCRRVPCCTTARAVLVREELIAEYLHLRGTDTVESICRRLGKSVDAFVRQLDRSGRSDLASEIRYRAGSNVAA
jgi:hypothetical protein